MKSQHQNILLIFTSLLFALTLAEILLRLVLPAPIIWRFPQENYLYDSEIGHRLEENQKAFTHDKVVVTNSRGIRDIEYSHYPLQGTIRIIALGDSQTFANGLALEDTWPKQLERKLNQSSGDNRFEVVNCGLPGSDTWQHEIMLNRCNEYYKPNAAILALYVNDIVVKPDRIVKTPRSDKETFIARWIYIFKRSALLLSLRKAYDSIRLVISPSREYEEFNALLQGVSNPNISDRWDQVEVSLSSMKNVTGEAGIGFMVVSLPRRDQVDGRNSADMYNSRLAAVMEKTGVMYLNTLASLQQSYKLYGKKLFIPWDGHNSATANKVIADEITPYIPSLLNAGLEY